MIRGIEYKCINCSRDVSLCFKCFGRRSALHNAGHEFNEIGPLYLEEHIASPVSWQGSHNDNDDSESVGIEGDRTSESSQGIPASRENGDDSVWPRSGDPREDLEFDTESSSGNGDESD